MDGRGAGQRLCQRVGRRRTSLHDGKLRDFIGFNRAKHAVVEAAILATRTAFLPAQQIRDEFARLAILVEKTAGEQESRAFALLADYVEEQL